MINVRWLTAAILGICTSASVLAQRPPQAVRVDPVQKRDVQRHRMVTGGLRALRRSEIAGQEPGLVVEIPVREGQVVKRGDLLARLNSRRLELLVGQMDAELEVTRAVKEARDSEQAWRQRDRDMLQSSYERDAANVRELDEATYLLEVAKARTVQSEREIGLNGARAALLAQRIEDMSIKAPFDGVVVLRHVDEGEWLGEGESVVELISFGPLEVWLNISQQHMKAVLDRRSPITLQVDALDLELTLNDGRTVPQVDQKARTFTMVFTLDNADNLLAPGMSVTAWVPTGEVATELTVPSDAVLRGSAGAYVYAARTTQPDAPPMAMPVPVQVLFPVGGRVAIRAGQLAEGDLVVVEGNERLFPSTPVNPILVEADGG